MSTKKKLKVHLVEITLPNGAVIQHYVRHYDSRQAQSWLLDARVLSRPATQDEVIDMALAGVMPVGPHEAVAEPDPTIAAQVGMFEGHAATDIPDSELADVASLSQR